MKIDLSKLPEGTKWIAIDSYGEVWAYSREPELLETGPVPFYVAGGAMEEWIGDLHD